MVQYSPDKSRIFAVASFVNIYSSLPVLVIRIAFALLLFILMFLFSSNSTVSGFYFTVSAFSGFISFEIFYRAKVLNEKPKPLGKEGESNTADSSSLETARLLLKTGNVNNTGHLISALLKNSKVLFVIEKADLRVEEIDKLFTQNSKDKNTDFNQILTSAIHWAQKEGRNTLDKLDILLGIYAQTEPLKNLFFQKGLKDEDLLNIVFWARDIFEDGKKHFWEKSVDSLGPGIGELWTGGWTLETEKYSVDLTKQIKKKRQFTPMVGRDKEIERVEEVLGRSEKKNVLLLGPPGIGKSTIVQALAERSIIGLLPPALEYKRFLEIDITGLIAGAAQGEMEQRIQNLLTELSHAGNVVLFMPDLENIAGGSGTGVNITGYLVNSLNSDSLQVIATSTRAAYRRYIEPQGTFAALFEPIELQEPEQNAAIRILEQAVPKIETKNRIVVTYSAVQKSVELATRYMVNRVLPGKAIDLIDEAATAISLKKKHLLEGSDIENLVSTKTHTPVKLARGEEAQKLMNLETTLHKRIVAQDEAIKAISNALRRARSIKRTTRKPIGNFLFMGPTGVGKTETAKTLAALYFGSEEAIIRVNMSEYQSPDSINRLIGAPPGTGKFEEGGEFTEKVRQNPYSLILLDELEKAHPKIQEAFLPILDEGIFEDVTGRKIVFTNTIIIGTSNAGAEYIRESVQEKKSMENLKKELLEKIQQEGVFKPEFLNRFDDIIVYKPLSESEVIQVVRLLVSELIERLKNQDVSLSVDNTVVNWIAKNGYDPTYGARPLRRFIADNLESKIANQILEGKLPRGSTVGASSKDGQLVFTPQNENSPPPT